MKKKKPRHNKVTLYAPLEELTPPRTQEGTNTPRQCAACGMWSRPEQRSRTDQRLSLLGEADTWLATMTGPEGDHHSFMNVRDAFLAWLDGTPSPAREGRIWRYDLIARWARERPILARYVEESCLRGRSHRAIGMETGEHHETVGRKLEKARRELASILAPGYVEPVDDEGAA